MYGYGYGYGYYGFDWTYILLIIGMLLSLAASARLKSTFSYYRKIRSASGLTGAETAERILRGDTARRDQCIFQSFENASEYRNSWE